MAVVPLITSERFRMRRRRSVFTLTLAGISTLAIAGCAPSEPVADGTPSATQTATSSARPPLSSFDAQVEPLLARMTLEEKVGQMTQADMSYIADDADVANRFLGSVLSGGGSDPAAGNSADAWRAMVAGYQAAARSTRLGIPLLYGVDAVHGHNNVVGAVVFPHNIGLGATRDVDLVEAVYRATAIATRATGINWSFAPCIAVPQDVRWGRTYEGFSSDPEWVTELGVAAILGLQGAGWDDPNGVLACAKHWLADGGTAFGTGALKEAIPESVFAESGTAAPQADRWPLDRGDAQMDEASLRAMHLAPYEAAIEAGVGSIMASFSAWNGVKLSGHRYLVTDVLKDELGFEGFVVSDWAAIDDLPGPYVDDVRASINAGLDMVMVPDKYGEFFDTLMGLAEGGEVPMERIDDAVRRILRVKAAMGLLDREVDTAADPALAAQLGSEAHRRLGRKAVRKSLVLLHNDGTLPLAKDLTRIHVAGKNADDLGNQCGGWTIQWQGASGPITEGTTILDAIRAAVGEDTEVTFASDGTGAAGADVAVVVIGETPYAEMMGDRVDLRLDAEDHAAVQAAADAGVPVVTVLVSGRPMDLGAVHEQSAAVIAAWLPGTEGGGVADVLFGDHPPTGRLPFPWPAGPDPTAAPPRFPIGFGLEY